MNAPVVTRRILLAAIRALADDYGEVAHFAGRIASQFGITAKKVRRDACAFVANGSLIRVGIGHYHLPDAKPYEPLPPSSLPEYATAKECGIEPYVVTRPIVRDGGIGFKNVTLSRVRWAERPLP